MIQLWRARREDLSAVTLFAKYGFISAPIQPSDKSLTQFEQILYYAKTCKSVMEEILKNNDHNGVHPLGTMTFNYCYPPVPGITDSNQDVNALYGHIQQRIPENRQRVLHTGYRMRK